MADEVTQKLEEVTVKVTFYTSEKNGSDETGDGTQAKPYKTAAFALKQEKNAEVYVDAKDENSAEKFELISKAQLKKLQKFVEAEAKKENTKKTKDSEDALRREQNLEAAKKIQITQDPSLPAPVQQKIKETQPSEQRVKVFGWVHRLRRQGKTLMFAVLRDGTGFLQCVFNGEMCQTYDAILLSTEATIGVYGVVKAVPEGKNAPRNCELSVDYWEIVGHSPAGGADNILNEVNKIHLFLKLAFMVP